MMTIEELDIAARKDIQGELEMAGMPSTVMTDHIMDIFMEYKKYMLWHMPLNDDERSWLKMADSFHIDGDYTGNLVTLERRLQVDGSERWVVMKLGEVLSKSAGFFVYESRPSSRTVEHLEDTRFASKKEAFKAWIEYKISEDKYKNAGH